MLRTGKTTPMVQEPFQELAHILLNELHLAHLDFVWNGLQRLGLPQEATIEAETNMFGNSMR